MLLRFHWHHDVRLIGREREGTEKLSVKGFEELKEAEKW